MKNLLWPEGCSQNMSSLPDMLDRFSAHMPDMLRKHACFARNSASHRPDWTQWPAKAIAKKAQQLPIGQQRHPVAVAAGSAAEGRQQITITPM
mmetsp:Transcript_97629/g.232360  ORF Transcript_97629/g.232360 Transcript_97629/m.232360 type:complete len:93 (-) Transcript_97629:78-356(-)